MQMQIQELLSKVKEAALDETRVKQLNELQQELTMKIDEMNSLRTRLAACLEGRASGLDTS